MSWAGHGAHMGEIKMHTEFIRKSEGKRLPLRVVPKVMSNIRLCMFY
jgi:hypothetical protein